MPASYVCGAGSFPWARRRSCIVSRPREADHPGWAQMARHTRRQHPADDREGPLFAGSRRRQLQKSFDDPEDNQEDPGEPSPLLD